MKKSMISKLVVLVVVMVVAGGFAFGATDSVDLNGTVTDFASIDFVSNSLTFDIDPITGYDASTVALKMTDAVAVANTNYTVSVSASTALTGQEGGETISYDVYLNGSTDSYTGTVTDGQNIPFGIKIDNAPAGQPYLADTYVGSVTLTIENN
jgi:hypothetical protein